MMQRLPNRFSKQFYIKQFTGIRIAASPLEYSIQIADI